MAIVIRMDALNMRKPHSELIRTKIKVAKYIPAKRRMARTAKIRFICIISFECIFDIFNIEVFLNLVKEKCIR